MLGSIGIKDGNILYHIEYDIIIGCPVINGVIGCDQLKSWLTDIGLVIKFSCIWVCYIGTPTCVHNVLITTSYRRVLSSSFINFFNLSSTKGKNLNSCPTC